MSNAVFPPLAGLSWGTRKSPVWNTRIQTSVGGRETRLQFARFPRWRWTLGYEFLRALTPFDYQYLSQFFNDRAGAWDSFLYSDPTDNTIADTVSARADFGTIGTGDASTLTYQLGRKQYASGTLLENIYNVNGTPKIYKNTTLQVVAVDYTISATGVVTFTVAPGVGVAVRWSGSYYWRVRFEQDTVDLENFLENLWSGGTSFISLLGS